MKMKSEPFRFYFPRSNGTREKLLISSSFMEWVGGYLPKKIFLRDRYLNLWLVKTSRVGGNWYFGKGWEKFIKDNKILACYSLEFNYFEEDLFDIKVMAPNGRETKGAGALVALDIDDETEEEEEKKEEDRDDALERQEESSKESEDGDHETEDSDDEDSSEESDNDKTDDPDYSPGDQEIEAEKDLHRKRKDIGQEIKVEKDLNVEGKDGDEMDDDAHDDLPNRQIKVEKDLDKESQDNDYGLPIREIKVEKDLSEESQDKDYGLPIREIKVEKDLCKESLDDSDDESEDGLPIREMKMEKDLSEESEDNGDNELPIREIKVEKDLPEESDDEWPIREITVEKDISEVSEDDGDDETEDAGNDLPIREIKVEQDFSAQRRDDVDVEMEDADHLPTREIEVEKNLYEESESKDDQMDDDDYMPEQETEVEQDLSGENHDGDDEMEEAECSSPSRKKTKVEKVKKAAVCKTKKKRNTPALYPKYTGLEIFQKGLATKPENPYFVVEIKAKRTNDLFIPLPLIVDYNIVLPKPRMEIVDPDGRKYDAKYKIWKDGRILYSGQFRALLRRNFLNVGDICIFEFMEGEKGVYLKASFIRKQAGLN